MALTVPTYPNPFDQANPITDAYAWIGAITLNHSTGQGSLVLNISPNQASAEAGCPPMTQAILSLGQVTVPANSSASPPVAGVAVITLSGLMAETTPIGSTGITFAQAFSAISERLYEEMVAKVPSLANATIAS